MEQECGYIASPPRKRQYHANAAPFAFRQRLRDGCRRMLVNGNQSIPCTPREKLIAAGVRNLKEFGYPSVTPKNILTDYIFRRFFKSMLEDNLGKGADLTIAELLNEIEEKESK